MTMINKTKQQIPQASPNYIEYWQSEIAVKEELLESGLTEFKEALGRVENKYQRIVQKLDKERDEILTAKKIISADIQAKIKELLPAKIRELELENERLRQRLLKANDQEERRIKLVLVDIKEQISRLKEERKSERESYIKNMESREQELNQQLGDIRDHLLVAKDEFIKEKEMLTAIHNLRVKDLQNSIVSFKKNIEKPISDEKSYVVPSEPIIIDLIETDTEEENKTTIKAEQSEFKMEASVREFINALKKSQLAGVKLKLPKVSMFKLNVGTDNLSSLYVRKAYVDIYNLINKFVLQGRTRFCLLGNSGVGKTCFQNYLLYRLLNDGKQALIGCHGRYFFVGDKYVNQVVDASSVFKKLEHEDTWLLLDESLTQIIDIPPHSKRVIITKDCNMGKSDKLSSFEDLIMPIWTWKELKEFNLMKSSSKSTSPKDLKDLKDRFLLWGGIPKRLFQKDTTIAKGKEDVKEILEKVSWMDIFSNAETIGINDFDDRIFHVTTVDYLHSSIVFSSRWVKNLVLEKLEKKQFWRFINEVFKANIIPSLQKQFFEIIAARLLSLGGSFKRKNLMTEAEEIIDIVQGDIRVFEDIQEITKDEFWIPLCENTASCDFVLPVYGLFHITTPNNEEYRLTNLSRWLKFYDFKRSVDINFVVSKEDFEYFGLQTLFLDEDILAVQSNIDKHRTSNISPLVNQFAIEIDFNENRRNVIPSQILNHGNIIVKPNQVSLTQKTRRMVGEVVIDKLHLVQEITHDYPTSGKRKQGIKAANTDSSTQDRKSKRISAKKAVISISANDKKGKKPVK